MGAIRGLISSAVRAAERFDEGQSGRRPSCCFISECQTAARVGSFSRRDCVRGLPHEAKKSPPRLTEKWSAHDPERVVSGFRLVFQDQSCATKKREAKRRKAHAVHSPHRSSQRGGGAEAIHRRQACAVCATCLLAGPLAFRRSAAALAPASERQDSAQAALHAKHDAKALPSLRIALKRGTSRAGRYAGGDDARTARERGYKPRPQEPHSLHQLAVTGRRP